MASAFICLPLLLQYYFFEATTLLKLGGGGGVHGLIFEGEPIFRRLWYIILQA